MEGPGEEVGAKGAEGAPVPGLEEVEGLAHGGEGPAGERVVVQVVEDGEDDFVTEDVEWVRILVGHGGLALLHFLSRFLRLFFFFFFLFFFFFSITKED